jgi:hypothetical protein
MLFLVVSEPRPGSPSSVAAAAWQRYWLWAEVLIAPGIIRSVHNRPQWARIRDTPGMALNPSYRRSRSSQLITGLQIERACLTEHRMNTELGALLPERRSPALPFPRCVRPQS